MRNSRRLYRMFNESGSSVEQIDNEAWRLLDWLDRELLSPFDYNPLNDEVYDIQTQTRKFDSLGDIEKLDLASLIEEKGRKFIKFAKEYRRRYEALLDKARSVFPGNDDFDYEI